MLDLQRALKLEGTQKVITTPIDVQVLLFTCDGSEALLLDYIGAQKLQITPPGNCIIFKTTLLNK